MSSLPASDPLRKGRRNAIVILLTLAIALTSLAVANFGHSAGQVAPNISFTSLKGEHISLAKLRGKVVLVNFWATSCSTCMHEMPQMVQTYNRYKSQGLEFVAVAMSYDRPDYVLNYAQSRQLPFTVALDLESAAARAFGGIEATPTTFLIGKDGTIIKRFVGEPEFEALHRLLEQQLRA
jgi:peroxiredoxin